MMKMGIKWLLMCFLAVSVLFVTAGSVYAAKITSFSADQVSIGPGGTVQHSGKMYVTPDKIRMEMRSPQGEGSMIVIMRRDSNLYWMLNPGEKKYFERPLDEKEWEQLAKGAIKSRTEKSLGNETINGYTCQKKDVETVVEVFGFKKKSRSTVWISEKLDLPIRTMTEDGHVTELRDIKKGGQPKQLFEAPGGYTKVGNMMELFAGSDREEKKEDSGGLALPKGLTDKLKGLKLPFGD
ncbi:MAG TPA: DUF4412 domain-containing protein [Syntrophales bacterium]|nr:DUF4412 domain-containing protein [Syntrophales bacterium]HPQ43106.1 DUF4412 domain-containing protein [Syntrophales bacterium]